MRPWWFITPKAAVEIVMAGFIASWFALMGGNFIVCLAGGLIGVLISRWFNLVQLDD